MDLSHEHVRLLGCLIEKQLATPQQYPLTLNSLTLACNQTSSRHPVVSYDEASVESWLGELKELRFVRFVLPSHGRSVVRYRQVLDEILGIDDRQLAVLGVMMLRGPQTVVELRTRTERMVTFEDNGEILHEMALLSDREDPLVVCVGKGPGQKEERWAHLLSGPPTMADLAPISAAVSRSRATSEEYESLRSELAAMRAELEALRAGLTELRESLGE